MRNEIYARHGYTFTTDEWKIFFASAEWYHADSAVPNDMLNATEKRNVDTIPGITKRVQADSRRNQRRRDMASQAALNYCQTDRLDEQPRQFCGKPSGGRILCQCDEDRRLG